ncbi:putative acyltransferase [Treponema primitia ZAS-2]|uniref:Putative acyltransferase n=1 Tax=Treponema primitia (strain ATCC BAA-887 / DSM 12427 / ZAS-2) TaxID=545694 RepID=F5YN48_TREPZ|nr:acyltransferase family protein [Treponema primitia]AEF84854.1 putative acyltransferase [Treponema primitia ZAS-2]
MNIVKGLVAPSQQPPRILWIDFAKTFGIWLVVFGHTVIPETMYNFILAFHMPLFFFISGYLEKNNRNFKETIIQGIKVLIIPYILLYSLYYTYWFVAVFLRHQELYVDESIISALGKPIIGMLLGIGSNTPYSIMLIPPLWFLWGLFFVKIIHKIIFMIVKERIEYYIMGMGIDVIIIFMLILLSKRLILSIDCAILAFPFYAIGNISRMKNLIKTNNLNANKLKVLIKILIAILGYMLIILGVNYNGRVDINNFQYGKDGLLFYTFGIVGIISTINLSQLYCNCSKIITILSNGTVIILAFHQLLNGYLLRIINIIGIEVNLMIIMIVSVVNVLLTIIPIIIIQKHFPILTGDRKLKYL